MELCQRCHRRHSLTVDAGDVTASWAMPTVGRPTATVQPSVYTCADGDACTDGCSYCANGAWLSADCVSPVAFFYMGGRDQAVVEQNFHGQARGSGGEKSKINIKVTSIS
jgi:hypothetical protein